MDLYRPGLLWPWLEEKEDTEMRRDKITAAAFAAAAVLMVLVIIIFVFLLQRAWNCEE